MNPKHILAALFVSLALNLFFGGVLLGRMHKPQGHWMQKDREVLQSLSESDRKILKDSIIASKAQRDTLKNELDEARTHVQEAMESGDRAAIDEALEAERGKKAEILKLMQQNRVDALQKISPEGRAKLAKMAAEAEEHIQRRRERRMSDFMADLGGPDDPDF